jgi:hypothetical protein
MVKEKSEKRRSTRATVKLKGSLEKRLAAYALAAGAAGVGAIIGPPQAEGQVVYTHSWTPISPTTATTNIDLNNDGIVDFVLATSNVGTYFGWRIAVSVLPQGSGNSVWTGKTYASALVSGVSVGPGGPFQPGKKRMAVANLISFTGSSAAGSIGPWRQATNLFLGVKFLILGEVHYGWVRVDLNGTLQKFYGAVSGYAYESTANAPIKTGQKSSSESSKSARRKIAGLPAPAKSGLGQLAIGALGLDGGRNADGAPGNEGK